MVARVIPVEDFDLVIFGGTGDLARRKILPGLYRRFQAGQMPSTACVIGAARGDLDDAAYRKMVAEALDEFLPKGDRDRTDRGGVRRSRCTSLPSTPPATPAGRRWRSCCARARSTLFTSRWHHRCSATLAERLHRFGIADEHTRIVVEKPFGRDLASAQGTERHARARIFPETQIYRIDHYLGKETVQNLMAVRFGNMLFEPLWNANYVDHIQITVAETVGVGGRGSYYDTSGAMRDMVQNHMMQLLCLIAMEPPNKFEPDAVRDEKLKVIRSLDRVEPHEIVRGQYDKPDAEPVLSRRRGRLRKAAPKASLSR